MLYSSRFVKRPVPAGLEHKPLIQQLINNVALALVLVWISSLLTMRFREGKPVPRQILLGLAFAVASLAAMQTPIEITEGLLFDARNILIALAGLLVGSIAAVVAVVPVALYRLHLGGVGAFAGVGIAITIALVAVAMRHFWFQHGRGTGWRHPLVVLAILSILLNPIRVLWVLTMPWDAARQYLAHGLLPISSIFTIGMFLIGLLYLRVTQSAKDHQLLICAERSLRESEQRLRVLFDHAADAIFVVDLAGRFTQVNRQACESVGYSEQQLLTMSVVDINHEFKTQQQFDELAQSVAVSQTTTIETVHERQDGSTFPVEVTIAHFQTADGPRLIGVARDTTQRAEALAAAREASAILYTALNCSSAGIAIADAPDGKLRFVNDAGLQVRGRSREELVDEIGIDKYVSSWQVFHLDGTPYRDDEVPLTRAIRYGERVEKQFIIRRPDGEDRIVLAHAAPVKNDHGQIIAGIVVFPDITELKRAEQKLRDSEAQRRRTQEKLEAAIEQSPSSIIIADAETGTIRMANVAATDVRGGEAGQLVDIPIDQWAERWRLYLPDGSPYPAEHLPLARALNDGQITKGEEVILRDEMGQDIWVSVSAAPIRDEDGNIAAAITIFDNVTEKKEQEQRRVRLNNELDHRVKNMMAQILALAHMDRSTSRSIDQFLDKFQQRLTSLSEAHDALALRHWHAADLQHIADAVLGHFPGSEQRCTMTGPSVDLPARIAGSIAICLNELATNAVKYGAWSNDHGQVELSWSKQDHTLAIHWQERHGPSVNGQVSPAGGLSLLRGLIEHEADGSIEFRLGSDGFECHLTLPIETRLVDPMLPIAPRQPK